LWFGSDFINFSLDFLMGIGHYSHILYFIDFGLAKEYRDLVSYVHHNLVVGKRLTGTARYASLNTHRGFEQARRDDLESIVYSLLYFLRGSLPWQGLKAKTKRQKYEKIAELKQTISSKDLCSGLPPQILTICLYVKSLTFDEQPDYDYIKRQLRAIIVANNQKYNYQFDWLTKVERLSHNKEKLVTNHNDF
jgi:serine/threonine protein kinase